MEHSMQKLVHFKEEKVTLQKRKRALQAEHSREGEWTTLSRGMESSKQENGTRQREGNTRDMRMEHSRKNMGTFRIEDMSIPCSRMEHSGEKN